MLYMDFNVPEERILNIPESWYNAYYDPSWFDDPEVVRIACEIDNLNHVWADFFEHSYTGRCCGKDISGGAMTVILAYLGLFCDKDLPLSWLGENCIPVLGSLDIKHDVTFAGDQVPQIRDFGCKFISCKTGKILDNYYDYYREYLKYAD